MLHILAVIGISALLHHSNVQSACYFKNVSVSCRRNVILAIDVTSNINRIEGLEEEFYFIEDWVIPQLDIRDGYVSVGMTAYGLS
uniref:VWFA domain-containing protein n=1 Tax=Heterorhabditis bacteriophora TaxID=37862 RepID=A0A1I7X1T2_HETBA